MASSEVRVIPVGDVPREHVEEARRQMESLRASAGERLTGLLMTLRDAPGSPPDSRFVADAIGFYDGVVVGAHTTAPTALEAGNAAADRLRARVRRAAAGHGSAVSGSRSRAAPPAAGTPRRGRRRRASRAAE